MYSILSASDAFIAHVGCRVRRCPPGSFLSKVISRTRLIVHGEIHGRHTIYPSDNTVTWLGARQMPGALGIIPKEF